MAGVSMNELDELLGAYALDAVSPEERVLVERYIETNPRARAEVEQHREVATMLAFSGASAPDGLWDRIAGQLDDSAPPSPSGELARVIPMVRPRSWLRRSAVVFGAAAAAAVVAVVVTRATSDDGGRSPLATAFAETKADRDARTARAELPDGSVVEAALDPDGHGYIEAKALPALPKNKTYQLWGVVGRPGGADQVLSFGIVGRRPEIETFSGDADLKAIVITIENEGGVLQDGNLDGAIPLQFG